MTTPVMGTPDKIYYVAPTGLDTNDGLTPATAFLTIGKAAIGSAYSLTKVIIAPGTYSETFTNTSTNNIYGVWLYGDSDGSMHGVAAGEVKLTNSTTKCWDHKGIVRVENMTLEATTTTVSTSSSYTMFNMSGWPVYSTGVHFVNCQLNQTAGAIHFYAASLISRVSRLGYYGCTFNGTVAGSKAINDGLFSSASYSGYLTVESCTSNCTNFDIVWSSPGSNGINTPYHYFTATNTTVSSFGTRGSISLYSRFQVQIDGCTFNGWSGNALFGNYGLGPSGNSYVKNSTIKQSGTNIGTLYQNNQVFWNGGMTAQEFYGYLLEYKMYMENVNGQYVTDQRLYAPDSIMFINTTETYNSAPIIQVNGLGTSVFGVPFAFNATANVPLTFTVPFTQTNNGYIPTLSVYGPESTINSGPLATVNGSATVNGVYQNLVLNFTPSSDGVYYLSVNSNNSWLAKIGAITIS